MVSTHSQYLCPDYLSPLPNSADAGKSPLALLAQTCNSIGSDPPSKSKCIQPAESPGRSKESSDKLTSKTVSSKTSSKHSPKECTTERSNSASTSAIDENANKASPSLLKPSTSSEETVRSEDRPTSAPTSTISTSALLTVPPSTPTASRCFPTLPAGYPNPYAGLGLPPAFSGLYSHGLTGLGSSPYPYPSLSLAGAFPRPCTDIMCKSCPPRPGGACLLGCTQCSASTHSPTDLSMWLSYNSLLHSMPHSVGVPPASMPMPPSSQVAPVDPSAAVKSLFGTSGTGGHVCSWLIKGTNQPCLKTFSSAEQLVQHLKVHTQEDQAKPNPSASMGRMSPRSMYLMSTLPLRYQPYPKMTPSVSVATSMPHLPNYLNPMAQAYSLNALYASQRLPGSLPHP